MHELGARPTEIEAEQTKLIPIISQPLWRADPLEHVRTSVGARNVGDAVDQGLDLLHHPQMPGNRDDRRLEVLTTGTQKLVDWVSVERPRPSPFMISMIFSTSFLSARCMLSRNSSI